MCCPILWFRPNNKESPNLPTYFHSCPRYARIPYTTLPGRDNIIFDSIAWQPLGEAFEKLSIGQCIQLSKYMNDISSQRHDNSRNLTTVTMDGALPADCSGKTPTMSYDAKVK
jgi:hypothetical protein